MGLEAGLQSCDHPWDVVSGSWGRAEPIWAQVECKYRFCLFRARLLRGPWRPGRQRMAPVHTTSSLSPRSLHLILRCGLSSPLWDSYPCAHTHVPGSTPILWNLPSLHQALHFSHLAWLWPLSGWLPSRSFFFQPFLHRTTPQPSRSVDPQTHSLLRVLITFQMKAQRLLR